MKGSETVEMKIVRSHARTGMRPPAVWRRSPVSARSPRSLIAATVGDISPIQDGAQPFAAWLRPGAAAELPPGGKTRIWSGSPRWANQEILLKLVLATTSMVKLPADGWNQARPAPGSSPILELCRSRQAGDGGTGLTRWHASACRRWAMHAQERSTIPKGGAAVAAPATACVLSRRMARLAGVSPPDRGRKR